MYRNKIKVRGAKQLDPKFVPIFFLMFSVIFISVGTGLLFYPKIKEIKCSETVTAEVIDVSSESMTIKSSRSYGRRVSTVFRPSFSFTYEGVEYIVESKTASNPPAFHNGEIVELHIDPKNPENFYAPSDKTTKFISIIFVGIGAVFLILVIALRFAFRRNENHEQ